MVKYSWFKKYSSFLTHSEKLSQNFKYPLFSRILLTDQLTDWLTDWLTDRPTDRLTDRPTDWLTDQSTDWLTDWLTHLLTHSLIHSLTPSLAHSLTHWIIFMMSVKIIHQKQQKNGLTNNKKVNTHDCNNQDILVCF